MGVQAELRRVEWFREIRLWLHDEAMKIPTIASILAWVGLALIAGKLGCCHEADERSGVAPSKPAPVDYLIQPTNSQPF